MMIDGILLNGPVGRRRPLGSRPPSSRRHRNRAATLAAVLACFVLLASTIGLHRIASTTTTTTTGDAAGGGGYDIPRGGGENDDGGRGRGGAVVPPIDVDVRNMRKLTLAHGTFHFGPTSHDVDDTLAGSTTTANEYYELAKSFWNDEQRKILDDEYIDVDIERERCSRYNWNLVNETHPTRRRLFMGALLGDDSLEVLRAVSTESYGIYHTVSYVEGFQAHDLSSRAMRYYDNDDNDDDDVGDERRAGNATRGDGDDDGKKSSSSSSARMDNLMTLLHLYGPNTRVSVDYYNTTMKQLVGQFGDLFMDFVGREGNTYRWHLNGMTEEDVGIIGDADEVFTRDFLRALQVCDVPELRRGQNCLEPQIKSSTLVYESSPECLTRDRRWFHPDAILGECVNYVGNETVHPPSLRDYADRHGLEIPGYGAGGSDFRPNYTLYHETGMGPPDAYPLWHGTDIRMKWIGNTYSKNDGSATAYHFHNYFENADGIHRKYATYGHAKGDRAYDMPIWALQEDIKVGVDCANRVGDGYLEFENSGGSVLPIYYLNEENRRRRHEVWKAIVKDEETVWERRMEGMSDLEHANEDCWMNCGEKSGECRHYCGKSGACCQIGHENSNNNRDCGMGTLGCEGRECCVAAAAR
jgi:hypothetical protein